MFSVHQRYGRTDGRTDRQTDGRLTIATPRFALRASRGKKCTCLLIDVATRCMVSKTWVEQYQMSFSNGLGEMGLGEMGLGELGLGEMGLGEMGGHLDIRRTFYNFKNGFSS